MVEDHIMLTYCLVENGKYHWRLWGAIIPAGENMVQTGCD